MVGVTTTGDPATETEPARVRLDRPTLVSNLVSGTLWLSPLAFPWSGTAVVGWPLFLIGAVYVVAGSLFLAVVYAHEARTTRQEVLAWIAPWLGAVALWMLIVIGVDFENAVSHYLFALYVGLLIATPCYLAWQIVALAIRQFLPGRPGRSSLRT